MRRLILLSAAALVLASCERPAVPEKGDAPAAPAASQFRHEISADQSGYYMPVNEVAVGNWRLKTIFMGQGFDFDAWEKGERSATFAPIMIEFEDVTSPMVQNELGPVRSGQVRVLPTTYSVTDTTIRFAGRSPELGSVSFEGQLDQGALATAKRNLGDEAPVLTGSLTAGGITIGMVSLRWWAGD